MKEAAIRLGALSAYENACKSARCVILNGNMVRIFSISISPSILITNVNPRNKMNNVEFFLKKTEYRLNEFLNNNKHLNKDIYSNRVRMETDVIVRMGYVITFCLV